MNWIKSSEELPPENEIVIVYWPGTKKQYFARRGRILGKFVEWFVTSISGEEYSGYQYPLWIIKQKDPE